MPMSQDQKDQLNKLVDSFIPESVPPVDVEAQIKQAVSDALVADHKRIVDGLGALGDENFKNVVALVNG